VVSYRPQSGAKASNHARQSRSNPLLPRLVYHLCESAASAFQVSVWEGLAARRLLATTRLRLRREKGVVGLLLVLTFDKPETLSDNDVRLPRPETHPRNGQKSPFCGEDSLTDTDGVKRTTAHADGGAVGVWSATHFRGVVILSLHPIVLSDVRQGVVHPLRRSRGCAEGGAGNRLTHDARTDNCVGRGHRAQGAIPATADSPSEKLIAKDANGPAGHR
jgi:hypothetical protein